MTATKNVMEPLKADDVKPIEYVDDARFYYVTLQFGALASWRGWQGTGRRTQAKNLQSGQDEFHHNPKIVPRVGAFPGTVVNGLISSHNEWIRHYNARKEGDLRGHVDRQRLVLEVIETNEIPKERERLPGMIPAAFFESFIRETVSKASGGPSSEEIQKMIRDAVNEALDGLTGSNE